MRKTANNHKNYTNYDSKFISAIYKLMFIYTVLLAVSILLCLNDIRSFGSTFTTLTILFFTFYTLYKWIIYPRGI